MPLVLYNGKAPWTAPTAIEDLIEKVPGGLDHYSPRLSYLLLDESRHQLQGIPGQNLVAAVFRLERSNQIEDMHQLVRELIAWLKAPEQLSIRRSFAIWIRRVLLPVRLPGQQLQEINDLNEVDAMLAERVKEWTHEWKQEGRQEGRQEGEAGVVLRLLKLKFGELDNKVIERIQQADEAQLLKWSERILTCDSLEAFFKA